MKKFTKQCALKLILLISIAGILFSGYLSYTEIFQQSSVICASGACGQQIAGIPVCVFGLIMYLIIFAIALCGLKSRN